MFKKLKSLFVIEDTPSSENKNDVQESVQSAEQVAIPSSEDVTFDKDAKPTEKFVNVLMKAIDEANQEGFDYLEYKQSLQSLSVMDMNDETRYQSALAMAKTMGVSVTRLIESAIFYQDILKKEDSKFQKALQQQKSKQISGREQDIKDREQIVVDKKQQIEKLKNEIETHQKELEKLKSGMQGAKEKIDNTRKGFAIAYHAVYDQIDQDIKKMKKLNAS